MRQLYEVNAEMENLLNDSIDPETGEMTMDEEKFMALGIELEQAKESYACYLKNKKAYIESMEAEKSALDKRIKSEKASFEKQKDFLAYICHGEKFKSPKCELTFRTSTETKPEEGFVDWALKTNNDHLLSFKTPEPNKVQIKKALAEGLEIPFVKLIQNTSMTIK